MRILRRASQQLGTCLGTPQVERERKRALSKELLRRRQEYELAEGERSAAEAARRCAALLGGGCTGCALNFGAGVWVHSAFGASWLLTAVNRCRTLLL